ncbi:hypothetical protein SAMN05421767_10644 [Granulicatella balaenopterae]|uniref:Phage protein n=1 Tax=Granulicatella balaenopterae TaxID=137733 RepID=A0A1H9IP24_9LACT|nr:hypothetical protein [Granulicatella balaenopterae]SEQ76257.1 hypothetical protein SAMN05421767_10644 [Granulicatella balaenopterae]
MNYREFYDEVVAWIEKNQTQAALYGFDSEEYFDWVYKSSAAICYKYPGNKLVKKQMMMLVYWIEEVYNEQMRGQ